VSQKKVPIVNMQEFLKGNAHEQKSFVKRFGTGLQEFGFVVVEGHGIASHLIQDSYSAVKEFFSLSAEEKMKFQPENGGGQRGYTGFGKEHAKNSKTGDLKEFWHVGREEYTSGNNTRYVPNVWPSKQVAQNFKPTLLELWKQLDSMAKSLLEATSEYLLCPRHVLPNMVENGNSILRCLHYPKVEDSQFKSGAVRAAAHEDINFITILCEATESGLELLTRDGTWLSVESGPGQMVVDSGDMLSRICNNVIPSTTHRVVNPIGSKNTARYSMPYFVHPHSKCELSVLPTCTSVSMPPMYAPILADDFLQQRLREIGLIGK
jgi:isopenicillin N synthase-like dioxygenase